LGNIRELWRASYLRGGATNIPAVTIQQTQYYPSGLPWSEGIGAAMQSRKYNGKEFVEMHGFDTYDYGARGYYPAMGRFLTVDRFAEKYPWQSPYCYAANNPVNYIDVNGDSIWISYNDANGPQRMLYNQGMTYNGNDDFISGVVNGLNEMGSVDLGETVLDQLSGSKNNYTFNNTFAKDKKGNIMKDAISLDDKTGQIDAAALLNPATQHSQKIESLGHELFHGYQTEFGETGRTINREVGGYLYGRALVTNLNYGALGFGNSTQAGLMYEDAMKNLMFLPYNQQDYNSAVNNFKLGASVNYNGLYNGFIIRSNNLSPIIRTLYPLVK
jgi:RHS repeat-associated protein